MDPLSVIAGIVGISAVAVKLISQLSEFVDDVHNSSTEVQALANELASFYASLGQVKLLLTESSQAPEQFNVEFRVMIKASESTLNELQKIITKAKRADSDRSATRVWKTVKFTFKTKQVDELRRRINEENVILDRMVLLLVNARGGRIERQLELLDEIHNKVDSLVRQNVKEVLVVLEREDETNPSQRGEFVLKDRTSRNNHAIDISDFHESTQHSSSPVSFRKFWVVFFFLSLFVLALCLQSSPIARFNIIPSGRNNSIYGTNDPNPVANLSCIENEFLDWTKSDAGQAAFVGAAGQIAEHFRRKKLGIGSGFSFEDQIARAGFSLSVKEQQALQMANTKIWPLKSASTWRARGNSDIYTMNVNPSRDGYKSLMVEVVPSKLLNVMIKNEKGETAELLLPDTDRRTVYFFGAVTYHKSVCEGNIVTITLSEDWERGPVDLLNELQERGRLHESMYYFETATDALEMHQCLTILQNLWMKLWELHTIAWSRVDPSIEVDSPELLRFATSSEISKFELLQNRAWWWW